MEPRTCSIEPQKRPESESGNSGPSHRHQHPGRPQWHRTTSTWTTESQRPSLKGETQPTCWPGWMYQQMLSKLAPKQEPQQEDNAGPQQGPGVATEPKAPQNDSSDSSTITFHLSHSSSTADTRGTHVDEQRGSMPNAGATAVSARSTD